MMKSTVTATRPVFRITDFRFSFYIKKNCKKCKKLEPVAGQRVQNLENKTEIQFFCKKIGEVFVIMVGKYKVITLCGSTRFKDAFMEAQKKLTLEGNIVISVGLFGHSGDDEVWTEGTKEMLDDMHKRKIDMADEIFVINVDGYIGESTRSEIEYAMAAGKPVRYLE